MASGGLGQAVRGGGLGDGLEPLDLPLHPGQLLPQRGEEVLKPDGLPGAEGQVVAVYGGGVGGRRWGLPAQGLSPQETGHPGQGAGQPAQADLLPAEPGQGAWRKTMVHGVPSFFGLVGFIINGNRGKPQFNVLSQFSHRPKEQPPPSPETLGKGAVGWQEAVGGGRGNHPLRFWSSRIRL